MCDFSLAFASNVARHNDFQVALDGLAFSPTQRCLRHNCSGAGERQLQFCQSEGQKDAGAPVGA